MRIIHEHLSDYITTLAGAISKDPASMEHWRCMHLHPQADVNSEAIASAIRDIQAQHGALDCDILHCHDHDVFFITRSLQPLQLAEMAAPLRNEIPTEATHYDLFRDWNTIAALLHSKTTAKDAASADQRNAGWHEFTELDSLGVIFEEAKQLRKARQPLHVLLAEDDPVTRRIVSNCLKDHYALITATSAEEALANYYIYAPDIVFLDIGLPDVNGFEVLHKIIKSDPEAYVVMFSGNSYLDNVTSALYQGAAGFIAKPFKKEKMLHYIFASATHHEKVAQS